MSYTLVIVIILALAYLAALIRVRRAKRTFPSAAPLAFGLGLAGIAVVLSPAFDGLADRALSWHMVQHLVLMSLAAPLLLLGAPARLALSALPTGSATTLARIVNSAPMRLITSPAFAWLQFAAVLYAVHFSGWYESALEHPWAHVAEHVLFFTSAIVFWMPLLAVAPAPHAPPHPVRLLSLFLALPMSAFLGFSFYVARHVLYPHYGTVPDALGDQANAGAIMWLAGGTPLFLALLWCVADWGARERRLGTLSDSNSQ